MRVALLPFVLAGSVAWLEAAPVTPVAQEFRQEIPRHHSPTNSFPPVPIQLLDRSPDGTLRAFGQGSWYRLGRTNWTVDEKLKAPTDSAFIVPAVGDSVISIALPWRDITQIIRSGNSTYVMASHEPYAVTNAALRPIEWPGHFEIRQAALDHQDSLWLASSAGLFQAGAGGLWSPVPVIDSVGRSWAGTNVLGVACDSSGQIWCATKAGVACRTGAGWRFWEGRDGLPWNDFTCISAGPGGEVWFGTRLGAIRWDGSDFHYRQGPGWLPNDVVRQILVDDRQSIWFATEGSLGLIDRPAFTLQAKADFYEDELARFIKRTPFGYTAEAPLTRIGDRTSAQPQDSDNDGLWTAMYGAGECFNFGATKNPEAKVRARQAFEALRFLQSVTQGGDHAPPVGYVARTIRPIEWPDPNQGRMGQDVEEQKRDVLWKAYEPRWPKSADGKWYWKSDTSSDELDGHYFFYALYFDLCADSEEERHRVAGVVASLTDHLMSHGFRLIDHDGTPTRWGVYSPHDLNINPLWWAERGLNSLSILTYLTVAGHVTSDPKYWAAAKILIDEHGYAQNIMYPKVQQGPGSGNHSDDEMAFMCYYNLLRLTTDDRLQSQVRYSFFQSWTLEQPELNPFFHFAYAGLNLDQSIRNVWGAFPVSPWPGWLEDSMATLRGFPLDRINWPLKNSHRLDIEPLARQKSRDLYQAERRKRGARTNGKVLPVENRSFEHWNTDPWELDYGGSGNVLGSGTVFLLPYYLGLYHGFIAKP